MKRYIAALLLACCVEGYAQEKKQAAFVPPFDFPLTLSGNFGEIRSNHFHGGLDFKTEEQSANRFGHLLTGISHVYVSPMVRGMCLTSVITTAIPLSTAI